MTNRDEHMRRHVPYEVWMLQQTQSAIASRSVPEGVPCNAYIELFAVHARCLIWFFKGVQGSKATYFTDPKYRPFAQTHVPEALIDKINDQITHVSWDRVVGIREQLNSDDIAVLRSLIEKELAEFLAHLTSHYCRLWNAVGLPLA